MHTFTFNVESDASPSSTPEEGTPAVASAKSARIHELLPKLLNSNQDENWAGLVEAIGAEDDRLASLLTEVRDQFFVKTASRPYLDRLAANNDISRPKFIGIGDADFRNYIPILAYQPKQVKTIIDTLLDLFFFKEATTAFLSSSQYQPFVLKNGWDLIVKVDNLHLEHIKFTAADFSNIAAATADEVAAAYNRQAHYSYATNYFDSVTEQNYIRIFTNTVGIQGSLEIVGGLSCIGLQLNGFISTAGTGSNTQWSVSKVGETTTFTYTGGALPGLNKLEAGDIFLCDLIGNAGSFVINEVDVQNSRFSFVNLFATIGSVTQSSATQCKFLRPERLTPYRNARRALAWETQVGKVTVEMPATPSIIQRGLKGGFHINGTMGIVSNVDTATSLTVADASLFPSTGQFVIEPVENIVTRLTGDSEEVVTYSTNGRVINDFTRYSYSGITGDTLTGISPNLPTTAQLNEINLTALTKLDGVVTCTATNDFAVGTPVIIRGSSGIGILTTTGSRVSGSPSITSIGSMTGVAAGQLVSGTGIPAGSQVLSLVQIHTPEEVAVDGNTIALWRLNESLASDAAVDVTGNSTLPVFSGSLATTTGQVGAARSFNGSSYFKGTITAGQRTELLSDITVEAWIRITDETPRTTYTILSACENGETTSVNALCLLRVLNTGYLQLLWETTGAANIFATDTTFINTNTVYHIAVARRKVSTNWYVDFYVNGVLSSTSAPLTGDPFDGSGSAWFLGANGTSGGDERWEGWLDDVRVSGIARTAVEVEDTYQRGRNIVGSIVMTKSATSTGSAAITFSENTNGAFQVTSASPSSFTYSQLGTNGTATTAGVASVERLQLADQNSKIIVTTSRSADDTDMVGPYIWDPQALFVLSSHTATATNTIVAGKTIKLLDISTNTMPAEEGYVVFDYGQDNQEGPVRYIYKPASNVLALDPSYIFQQNHEAGCSVVAINRKGPHTLSGSGKEYPPYITSPSDARVTLQELIKSVTSAGIFVDFLVRYPTQLYGTLSVYD